MQSDLTKISLLGFSHLCFGHHQCFQGGRASTFFLACKHVSQLQVELVASILKQPEELNEDILCHVQPRYAHLRCKSIYVHAIIADKCTSTCVVGMSMKGSVQQFIKCIKCLLFPPTATNAVWLTRMLCSVLGGQHLLFRGTSSNNIIEQGWVLSCNNKASVMCCNKMTLLTSSS